MNKPGSLARASFLSAVLAFYCWLALIGIRQQGLYFDIALLGNCALGLYRGLPWDPRLSVPFFGRNMILMVDAYHGSQESFLALPWIYAFKNTTLALNLASVSIGLLAIPAVFWTAELLFDDFLAAAGACLLMTTSPSFIAASRLGLWTGIGTCVASIAALGCLVQWRRTRRAAWGALAAALLGFGLGCRVQFLWFIAALALGSVLLDRRGLRAVSRRAWLAWVAASMLGLLPQIIVNARERLLTVRYLAGFAFDSKSGVDNLAFVRNIGIRLAHLRHLIGGSAFFNAALGDNPVPLSSAGLAFGLALLMSAKRWRAGQAIPRRIALPWMLIVFMLAESTVTPDFMDVHHLIMLLPLTCLAAAGTLVAVLRRARAGVFRAALASLLIMPVLSQGWRLYEERPWTQLHGGWEVRWDMVQRLVDWLRGRRVSSVALGDTGLMDPVMYLSGGDIAVDEIFWAPYRTDTTLVRVEERLQRKLREEPGGFYVFRAEGAARIPFLAEFLSQVRAAGKRARVVETISTPDGHPLFVIYQVG